ncbi:MAG: DUF927 domain-containing protein [Caulobacter sp.]
MTSNSITTDGVTDQLGIQWLRLQQNSTLAWLRVADLHDGSPGRRLAELGIVMPPGKAVREFIDRVGDITDWPKQYLATRPGWHRSQFALGDGSILAPKGENPHCVAFHPDHAKWGFRGTLEGWRTAVAAPLAKQPLPAFAIMLAFAPPLLNILPRRTNFGVEFVGLKGLGKSTLQQLVSSVWAGPGTSSDAKFWETWLATAEGLETVGERHRDCLLVLDEATLFEGAATKAARAKAVQNIVFRLGEGAGKARFGGERPEVSQLIYLSSSNEPIASVLGGGHGASADAAEDRLLTLPADAGSGFGVYSTLPDGVVSGSAFASQLTHAVDGQYGTAIRAFLAKLVQRRSDDQEGLTKELEGHMAHFRKRAQIDPNDGSMVRVANSFGVAYAAGRLAKGWGILPKNWRCADTALTCFQRHLAAKTMRSGNVTDRLTAYAKLPGVRDVRGASKPTLSDAELKATPGIWRTTKEGEIEFVVWPETLKAAFSDCQSFVAELIALGIAKREPPGHTVKRKLREGHDPERFYCFRITPPTGRVGKAPPQPKGRQLKLKKMITRKMKEAKPAAR